MASHRRAGTAHAAACGARSCRPGGDRRLSAGAFLGIARGDPVFGCTAASRARGRWTLRARSRQGLSPVVVT